MNAKEADSHKEKDAACWGQEASLGEGNTLRLKETKHWDILDCLHPPYPPALDAAPPHHDGPSQNIRERAIQKQELKHEGQATALYPLQEVPLGGAHGGIGFLTVLQSKGI